MDARAALEGLDCAHEISKILDCGLDRHTLSICLALLENGVNPEVGAAMRAGHARQVLRGPSVPLHPYPLS